jgi:hypothetical protein
MLTEIGSPSAQEASGARPRLGPALASSRPRQRIPESLAQPWRQSAASTARPGAGTGCRFDLDRRPGPPVAVASHWRAFRSGALLPVGPRPPGRRIGGVATGLAGQSVAPRLGSMIAPD